MSERQSWRIRFASFGKAVHKRGSDVATDASALVGAGLIAYGAGLVYRPAGFIVLGSLLILGAFLAAKGKR